MARIGGSSRDRSTRCCRTAKPRLEGGVALKQLLAANKRLNTAYLLKESLRPALGLHREAGRGTSSTTGEATAVATSQAVREVSPTDRATLGRHRRLLQAREQGRARLRRRAQQQDPRHPASRLRVTRRGIPPPESPHLHAAGAVKSGESTHTASRRPEDPLFYL